MYKIRHKREGFQKQKSIKISVYHTIKNNKIYNNEKRHEQWINLCNVDVSIVSNKLYESWAVGCTESHFFTCSGNTTVEIRYWFRWRIISHKKQKEENKMARKDQVVIRCSTITCFEENKQNNFPIVIITLVNLQKRLRGLPYHRQDWDAKYPNSSLDDQCLVKKQKRVGDDINEWKLSSSFLCFTHWRWVISSTNTL